MPMQHYSENGILRRNAILLALLMILLPWCAFTASGTVFFGAADDVSLQRNDNTWNWGVNGSNDTGWIDLTALGADPTNETLAYGDLMLEFAPGAVIDNLSLEISVNGSDGYWVNQPQLTLMNTQTEILDWRGLGDLGRQNHFTDNSPTLVDSVLDASLKPNSISDASWQLPTGIEITDLVIEALRPVDPKLSLTPLEVDIHDSAYNPYDGRLYLLVDDDLLHLDDNANKHIIDLNQNVAARSLAVDFSRNSLFIGDVEGNVSAMHLSDSTTIDIPNDVNISSFDPILAMVVDVYGVAWAATECTLHYLLPAQGSNWNSLGFCTGTDTETPTEMLVVDRQLFVATESHGVHNINYSTTSNGATNQIEIDSNTIWDSNNHLSGDSIVDIAIANDILYVATSDSGIDRFDISSTSWLGSWSSANWLSSDNVVGLSTTPGWLYILEEDKVHAYDTDVLLFRSVTPLSDFGLTGTATSITAWPGGATRSPATSTALVGDSSGTLGRMSEDSSDGTMVVVSSPSIEDAEIVAIIDDGEMGEFWIASGSEINFMDRRQSLWKEPFDLADEVSNPGSITGFVQDDDGWVWVSTTGSGVHRLSSVDGSFFGSIQGLNSNQVTSMDYDTNNGMLVIGHFQSGVSLYSTSSNSVTDVLTTEDGLDSDSIRDIATRYGIAYIATGEQGVMRIDLSGPNIIGSWQSLEVDNLDSTPIAVDGGTIYLGLPGLGILVIDRFTKDIINLWTPDQPDGIPDADVNTILIDYYGGLLVGSEVQNTGANSNGGLARWDGSGWELLPTSIQGWNNDPFEFYDLTSDDNGVYAGTNRGACMWSWPDPNDPNSATSFTLEECWSTGGGGGGGGGSGMPSRFVISVDVIGTDRLYAGTFEGAAVINTANGTVIDVWTAGDDTQRARVVKIDDIIYLGFENVGVARYNLTSREWLSAWDGTQGIVGDDDVTTLIHGIDEGTIWAGGDAGLTLIDVVNESVLIDWSRGSNQNGPTLPTYAPGEILIVGNVMYYSPQRGNSWNSRDEVHRINLANNSSLQTIDAGARLGYDGVIHGMNQIGSEVWIGVRESSGWGGGGDEGTIVRWNTTSNDWMDNLETIGDVGRVNARYLGDCFPLNSSCELWVAYGDKILRRFSANNMTLLDQWNDVDGRIRGMVEYQGEYLFASMNGILRWNPDNESWLPPWLPDDGLPADSELDFYSMTVVGDDLWASSGDQNDALVMRLSGNNSNWTTWEVDTTEIPDGYGADIVLCNDIVHVALGFNQWGWWQSGGGVARFDLSDTDGNGISEEWIPPLTDNNDGTPSSYLSDNDARALACDEANGILYIGFDTEDVGIDRFSYNSNDFLGSLTIDRGVSGDRVFPGGMLHDDNLLLVAHYGGSGGITRVITSGASASNAQVISTGMDACSIVRAPSQASRSYAIGRSGDSSGINRVDRLDSTGLIEGGFDALVGLPSGTVSEMISNGTHVWVAVGSSANSYLGSTILQGELLDNGSVNWQYGFDSIYESINEIALLEGEIWLSTVGGGLWSVDLSQRTFQPTPTPLHNQMDGLLIEGNQAFVGLMGIYGSSAGFQTFNTDTRTWGHGSLIAGLPSNTVTDFVEYGDHILIATHGGIGMWNTTKSDWDDPLTTLDGLPTPIIDHLFITPSPVLGNGTVLTGGPNGINVLDSNLSLVGSIGRIDGLIGDAVAGIVFAEAATTQVNDTATGTSITLHHDAALFISHNGQGSTRPGASAWDLATDKANGTYNIDMLPSNDVRAIAADDWGVHIATSTQPLVHWNGMTMTMEAGPVATELQAWPIIDLASDGTHIAAISANQVSIVKTGDDHGVVAIGDLVGAIAGEAEGGLLIALGEDGPHIFHPMETLNEMPRESQRRAEPLTAIFVDRSVDITNTTSPGMSTVLATPENPVFIPLSANQENSSDILVHPGVLTFTSPQAGAWVWARSTSLNYSGNWDLAAFDSMIENSFQTAIFNTPPGSPSSILHLQLQSPSDGRIKIRLTYDWERLEAPTMMTELVDRPNDGGGVLQASWIPAQDSAWIAYRVYLWDSTNDSEWTPTIDDLEDMPSYLRVPYWSQTTALFSTGNSNGSEVQLSHDRQYRAAISIEYGDGTLGEPISWEGNATPTDEVPSPPEWLTVEPVSGGDPGTLTAEWSACRELDPYMTRIWAVQQEISNALALSDPLDFAFAAGNTTVLELEGDVPYWFAVVCVDESGQSNPANATVVGPVVAAGGLNDGIPPSPITGTVASDAPNDEGGRIQVTWDPNQEEDCSYHIIYVLPASGWTAPTTVDGWPIAAYVPDCTTGELVIDSIGNSSLENGIVYWVGVVAVDDWGNLDVDDVLVVETTPYSELDSLQWVPPDLVTGLQAWDHPSDDGTAVDVIWDRSTADDFSHYTVWVSDYPLDDLSVISSTCEQSGNCDLLIIDQRQIGNSPRLEVTVGKALYGNEADSLAPSGIIPLVPLYVTVTVHDITGNVQLMGLGDNIVLVTPLDNTGDLFPPDRIPAPTLEDRSPDSGDGVLVGFSPSNAPDIGEYWIYAVQGSPFDNARDLEPALVLDRSTQTPVLLETVSGGEAIVADIPMWIAIVSVDTSGNAWLDDLSTSMISTVDEDGQDPGLHLPEVSDVIAYWDPSGSHVQIMWDALEDPQVSSYSVFASNTEFTDVRDAMLVASGVTTTNATFDSLGPTPISSSNPYWIVVVASDGDVTRLSVNPAQVRPLTEFSLEDGSPGKGASGASWYDQLVGGDLNMLIALVSALMILMGAVLIIKPRDRTAPEPWEMGTREVEMEEELAREATGISEDEEIASASGVSQEPADSETLDDPTTTSFSQGQEDLQPQSAPEVSLGDLTETEPQEVELDDLNEMADELGSSNKDEDIDASFIDEALEDDS